MLMVPGFVLLALAGFYMASWHLRQRRHGRSRHERHPVRLVLFGVLMVLLLLRVPIGIAMFMVGAGGYVVVHRRRMDAAAQFAEESGLRAAVELRPDRHPAVPADGPVRHARRACRERCSASSAPSSVTGAAASRWRRSAPAPASARSAARRSPRPRRWARWRCRNWSAPGIRAPGHRRAGGRRHAGHHDPALGAAGDLRHPHPGVDRQAVHGRDRAGPHRDARLHAGDPDPGALEAAAGTGRHRA